MKNEIALTPKYVASISGGKDSVYMLMHILANIKKYPLDYVVYFELETDYPFIRKVIDHLEIKLKNLDIDLLRIKPRKKWDELYIKYGYPSIFKRWCNSAYKLDCQKQLNEWLKSFGCRPIMYIGFCADEVKRFKYKIGDITLENKHIYPLAEDGIEESQILEWAKYNELFNDYYKFNRRCGCMGCPMASMKEWAYMFKYYPNYFSKYICYIKRYEDISGRTYFREPLDSFINKIKTKYVPKLKIQYDIYGYLKEENNE